MKNLFYFLTVIILFSCSSNDDTTEPKIDSNVKYPVNFKVSGFKLTEKPLLKTSIGINDYYLQHIFYKEDGSVYETDKTRINSPTDPNISLTKELPVGKYRVALMIMVNYDYSTSDEWDPSLFALVNIETDIIRAYGTYFKLKEIEVTPAGVSLDVELEPMWSTVDIKFSDAATCYIPEKTDVIAFFFTESSGAFYVKDQKPWIDTHWSHQWVSPRPILPEDFRKMTEFKDVIMGQINNTKLCLRFQKSGATGGVDILHERILYEGKLERGKHYTLEGEIGTPNAENKLKIRVSDFEDITLPFDKQYNEYPL